MKQFGLNVRWAGKGLLEFNDPFTGERIQLVYSKSTFPAELKWMMFRAMDDMDEKKRQSKKRTAHEGFGAYGDQRALGENRYT